MTGWLMYLAIDLIALYTIFAVVIWIIGRIDDWLDCRMYCKKPCSPCLYGSDWCKKVCRSTNKP